MTLSAVYRIFAVSLGFQFLLAPFAYSYFSLTQGVTDPTEWLASTANNFRSSGVAWWFLWSTVKGSFVLPFVYHIVNGCRHLGWDQFAYGIRHLGDVYTSGNVVIAVTVVLSVALILFNSNEVKAAGKEE